MKKFTLQMLLIYFLPALCIAVVAEYSIRKLPNDYSFKNQWMEKNCKSLNTLCLGPSSIYYAIDPTYFEKKTFNASHISQSINYDNYIFNKFINKMDSLQCVILCIDYWSPFSSLENYKEWWRARNYSIYYECDIHKGEIKYNYELYTPNYRTFKMAVKGFLTAIGLKTYSNINVNEHGYGINYSSANKNEDWDNGKSSAMRHNKINKKTRHLNLINKNTEHVKDIVKKCAARNVDVLLITTPTLKSYRENLDNYYLQKKNNFCNFFVKSFNNVSFIDFSDDNRFSDEDFFDASHLNEIGAKKLTKLVNAKILQLN